MYNAYYILAYVSALGVAGLGGGGWGGRLGGGERLHLLVFCVRSNPLAKELSIKEMLNFRHKDSRWLTVTRGFEECLENVLCILEGK